MQLAILIVLALVVAIVAIDAIGRLDERKTREKPRDRDPGITSTQKIVVDLTKRS